MRILYIIGEPGVGKSTLMRALTATLGGMQVEQPVPHVAYRQQMEPQSRPHAAEIGVRRGNFAGTDGMSMSIQPQVLAWLEAGPPYPLLVGEGDRLANGKFFDAVQRMGYELAVLHLWAAESVVAARRAGRGGRQNAKWVQGRQSKVARLAARYSAFPWEARQPAMVMAEHLAALPGPVGSMVRQLREGRVREQDAAGAGMLVLQESGGNGSPAGLPVGADVNGGPADAGDTAEEGVGEPTADTAIAPPDGPGSAGGD